jgi:hypothetical protein
MKKERYESTDGTTCATVWIEGDCSKLRMGLSPWTSALVLRRGRAKWFVVPFNRGGEMHPVEYLAELGEKPRPSREAAVVNYLDALARGDTVMEPWSGVSRTGWLRGGHTSQTQQEGDR